MKKVWEDSSEQQRSVRSFDPFANVNHPPPATNLWSSSVLHSHQQHPLEGMKRTWGSVAALVSRSSVFGWWHREISSRLEWITVQHSSANLWWSLPINSATRKGHIQNYVKWKGVNNSEVPTGCVVFFRFLRSFRPCDNNSFVYHVTVCEMLHLIQMIKYWSPSVALCGISYRLSNCVVCGLWWIIVRCE